MNNVQINHTRCGLMIGILVLHLEKSGSSNSSDSPNKIHVTYVT